MNTETDKQVEGILDLNDAKDTENGEGILLDFTAAEWAAAEPLTGEKELVAWVHDLFPADKNPAHTPAWKNLRRILAKFLAGYGFSWDEAYALAEQSLDHPNEEYLTWLFQKAYRRQALSEEKARDLGQRLASEVAPVVREFLEGIDSQPITLGSSRASVSQPGAAGAVVHKVDNSVGPSLLVTRGDQVEMQVVQWFWHNKFASKELNVLCGMPDRGKGTLLADLIARVTTGTPLPGETEPRVPADVLIFSGEETIETTTLPRVVAAGGNRSRLHFVRGIQIQHDASREARSLALDSDSHLIRDYLNQHPDIELVILDPVNSYFSGDKNSSQETRKVYGALKSIADECDVCFVLVDHFNKNTFQNALHRINGAQDAGAAPRSAWVIEKDEDNPEIRHLACLKCNIISDADKTGWKFKIVSQPVMIAGEETSVGRVEWLGVSKKSAEELVSKKPEIDAPQLKTARAFYQDVLDAGESRLQTELYDELAKLGVGKRTAKRAMREMGISGKSGLIKKIAGRWWLVPSGSETDTGQESQEGQGCQP